MINVIIDEFTPCLKDAKTGELVQTEVIRIRRKTFLRKYNKKNGWYVNWETLADENEIYALVVEGSVDIQGLVAVAKDQDLKAVYITWMCTSPDNNKLISDDVKYLGVGGHLFAIAAQKSIEYGYDGFMYGFAADQKLLDHYINAFKGEYIGMLHPYQFAIDERSAVNIMEVYDYEWTDEEI
ncbi:MAG: hypothetical protein MJ116_06725 [Lachnospiraceae bacterium]|nr:hypothetical protein [Lachnospiraceae bacterium]